MRLALSVAVLLGVVKYTAGFACNWDGSGSSYVWHDTDTTEVEAQCWCSGACGCNCNAEACLATINEHYFQSTCCRCATEDQCQLPPPTNYDNEVDSDWFQGCDLYAPVINIADAVEAASAPGMWFTSPAQLNNFLETTVECTDDCMQEPTCLKNWAPFGNCQAYVTVTSEDWVGCANRNTIQKSFYVRYDTVAPVVTVTLGTFMAKKETDHRKYEDISLEIGVTEACDPYPEVTITVYSDEIDVHELDKPAAILERRYSDKTVDGRLQGWGLTLNRYRYAQKLCGPTLECLQADGRFYIVRVCAKDQAGLWSCTEKSVGVPLKPLEAKHITPTNNGKLFVVAEDRGFWNLPPNEIPFRNENTFLSENGPANHRLCWSNQIMAGAAASTETATDQYKCAAECALLTNCVVFEYNFYSNTDNCKLFTSTGSRVYLGNGVPDLVTGRSIFAMGNRQCPV